jgi:hypothetical protein
MDIVLVGIFVEMVYAVGVKLARPALNAMYLVALLKKKLCEIGPILSGDAGDQGHGSLSAGTGPILRNLAGCLFIRRHLLNRSVAR